MRYGAKVDTAKRATPMGLEPTTFRSEGERAIHCATRPIDATPSHLLGYMAELITGLKTCLVRAVYD